MYLSKSQLMVRILFVIFTTVTIFACSSIPNEQPASGNKNAVEETSAENDKVVASSAEVSEGGAPEQVDVVAPFDGVDPMADIQINAKIKKAYQKVASLDSVQKYDEALALLDNLKNTYPQLSGPAYQKARIYINQNKLDEALTAIDSSLTNNPRNYYALNLKGIILREKGDFEAAKSVYFKAIEVYPPYPNSHLNLGLLADLYLKDLPLALIQYQRYMKLTGNSDKTVKNWIIELERRIKAGN